MLLKELKTNVVQGTSFRQALRANLAPAGIAAAAGGYSGASEFKANRDAAIVASRQQLENRKQLDAMAELANDNLSGNMTSPEQLASNANAKWGPGEIQLGELAPRGSKTPWMDIASGELGQTEIPGAKHNSRILEYHATTSYGALNDETAWCSSFANWTMEQAGYQGTNNATARSWLNWGTQSSNYEYGSLAVVQNRASGQFHVGFAVKATPNYVRLLGGNQGLPGSVKFSNFSLSNYKVLSFVKP